MRDHREREGKSELSYEWALNIEIFDADVGDDGCDDDDDEENLSIDPEWDQYVLAQDD